ncbi:MAG TPA: hypothetical protein VK943_04330, partial [Arenibaculum sp.]|nr:hypothetical protein [Arenibaculum sp.]
MTSFARADKPAVLAELRNRIRRLEGVGGEGCRVLPLGSAIDAALPDGGLPLGCLHELAADGDGPASERGAAATAFAAALLARIAAAAGPVLWIGTERDLFAPGLAAFGLTPDRLIVVRARRTEDVLWAMEEALRSHGIGGVLGEVAGVGLTAS